MKWEQMNCPECGEPVHATHEKLEGQAILVADGEGGYSYEGTTEVFWDDQRTIQENGEDCLLCPEGHEWTSKRIED